MAKLTQALKVAAKRMLKAEERKNLATNAHRKAYETWHKLLTLTLTLAQKSN